MTNNSDRIEDLLQQVNDPVLRAIVVVLNSINRDVTAQTDITKALVKEIEQTNVVTGSIETKLTKHIRDEEQMVAGFRGQAKLAVWIGPVLFSCAAGIGSYLWAQQDKRITALEAQMLAFREIQIINVQKIHNLEQRREQGRDGR